MIRPPSRSRQATQTAAPPLSRAVKKYAIGCLLLLAVYVFLTVIRAYILMGETFKGDFALSANKEQESPARPPSAPLDSSGVFQHNLSDLNQRGIGGGITYNPRVVANGGIYFLDLYKQTENPSWLDSSLIQARWLARNQKADGSWHFLYDLGAQYNVKAPFVSALGQGRVILFLVRIFNISNDSTYLRTAEAGLRPLYVPLERGGVRSFIADSFWFYEEIPTIPPHHILNGFLSALMGIYELSQFSQSDSARELLSQGIRTIVHTLDKFDTGYWSRYAIDPNPGLVNHYNLASPFYHRLHQIQLEELYDMTGNPYFRSMRLKWAGYNKSAASLLICSSYVVFKDVMGISKILRQL